MSASEIQQLKADYVLMARYFRDELADDVLLAFTNDLSDLPYAQVQKAMLALRRDPKTVRCPLPSSVRARIQPEENPEGAALLIAGKIADAVARFGPYRTEEVVKFLGPRGMAVVKMSGGWTTICELTTDQLGTHRAQWAKLARALSDREPMLDDFGIGWKPAHAPGLSQIGDLIRIPPRKEQV